MAGMHYQPQGLARLNRANPLVRGAQAVVTGGSTCNLVTGQLLTLGGLSGSRAVPVGRADSFRKNSYRATELLPAIGTSPYVEYWVGYPNASKLAGNSNEPGFLTGSSNNSTGIAQAVWAKGPAGQSDSWGAVRAWPSLSAAQEVLIPDQIVCLVVVRRSDRMEFWRDGILVNTVLQSPTSHGASKFLVGSFIEASYWYANSDMVLAGRVIADWTHEQVRSFQANPWQIFSDIDEDYATESLVSAIDVAAGWSEAKESFQAEVSALVNAAASWAEGGDGCQITGKLDILASAAWVEASESTQISGRFDVLASAAWAEASESTSAQGMVGNAISVAAAWVEGSESSSIGVNAKANVSIAFTEQSESVSAGIQVGSAVSANIGWVEASDSVAIQGSLRVSLLAGWVEGSESQDLRATSGDQSSEIDALLVPARQTVVFEGSRRIVAFEGSKRVVSFEGSKRMVDFQ